MPIIRKIVDLLKDRKFLWNAGLVAMLVIALGVRLVDLTDPPLDFHPTAQLLNAVVARGMYYQMSPSADPALRDAAIQMMNVTEVYEPRVLSRLVALTYLLIGGEQVWVARIYSSIFWVIGGLLLFLLARQMVSRHAALVSIAYFLFLPFAIIASRTFQTSSLMIMLLVFTLYAFYRWIDIGDWKWSLLAGGLAGVTVLFKITIVFQVGGLALVAVLWRYRLREALRQPKVWVMAFLSILPSLIYYIIVLKDNSSSYFQYWAISEWYRLLAPGHYVRWLSFLDYLVDLPVLFISLAGTLIASPRVRAVLISLWIGYVLQGLFFPYHTLTHEYYNLQIVPVLALGLAPLAELVMARVRDLRSVWRVLAAVIALVWFVYPAWVACSQMLAKDHRQEPAVWRAIGQALPDDGTVIALTQDSGFRLSYYGWRISDRLWPWEIDLAVSAAHGTVHDPQAIFDQRTQGMHYFLVTAEQELNSQTTLRDLLYNHYTLIASGDSYLIFDLTQPLPQP